MLLKVVRSETAKVILPEEVKDPKVRYVIEAVGTTVPEALGLKKGDRVIMKPHTYMVGHDDFKEFVLVDCSDVWGVVG